VQVVPARPIGKGGARDHVVHAEAVVAHHLGKHHGARRPGGRVGSASPI